MPAPDPDESAPYPPPKPAPTTDVLFGRFWPEEGLRPVPNVLISALLVGALGAITLPDRRIGLAACIVVLLAGMSVVTAAQDTLDGFYLTAGARTYEVMLLTGGVVAGVLLVLSLARRIGVNLYVIPSDGLAQNVVVQILAGALLGGAFAVSAYCAPRAVLVSIVTGGVSWFLFATFNILGGTSQPVASGIATFLIGCAAPTVARQRMSTMRISPEGRRRVAYLPSRATSCTDAPAERPILAPPPGRSSTA